ncbi:LysR family transcriptional regulator [Hyphomonas sp.]|jgi:DNA-binding transcriptional LysR family regulator|uniref:LysR family transcriptional regulator n=1 Tax=Hyphomonas sp. TaxID=87 RepID=UPI0032D8F272
MDRLAAHRIFFAVADHGSFSAAARSLGIEPSRASRAVAALETELGVVLLRRSTRAVALTEEGTIYLEASRLAVTDLDQAAAIVSSTGSVPQGLLTVSAPLSFGRLHVVPVITRLLREHERFDVRLRLLDRVVSLAEEGIDLAVRIGDLPDSSLRATKLAETRQVLTASEEYLARAGKPTSLYDLKNHQLIALEEPPGSNARWLFASNQAVRVRPRLQLNSADAAIRAACLGVGIARSFSYQVADELAAGNLVRILSKYEPPAVPISALYQVGRRKTPNIRHTITALRNYLASKSF